MYIHKVEHTCSKSAVQKNVQDESNKVTPPKAFAYISACGHPPWTKIYPVVRHSYPHLCTNFDPLLLIFVTLTPEF